jgi:hypothetical protein
MREVIKIFTYNCVEDEESQEEGGEEDFYLKM